MRVLSSLLLALFATGEARAQDFNFEIPPAAVAMRAAEGGTQPITLTRAAASIPAGTAWGEIATGSVPFPCKRDELLKWQESDNEMPTETFARVVRDEFKAAGFATSGDPTNLFERDAVKPELQLGALITNLRLRYCYREALPFKEFWDTSLLMNVEWQVYSVTQGKVVARLTTTGAFQTKTKNPSLVELLSGGFADNVRRLTQSDEFRKTIARRSTGDTPAPAMSAAQAAILFKPSATGKAPLSTAVRSVVSIFAGDGLGSGVLISSDGYILTNHHVAGASGRVRVRWADGVETVGEVIRSDARRDIALIKTPARATALGLRTSPPELGETVFAVGTPLEKELAGTLTRGIISADRLIEGQRWLQSDVAVTHGNSGGPLLDESGAVLGLTAWGIEPGGASANINFFIPIADALKALALQPAS